MIVINWSIGVRGSLVLDERGSIEAVVVRDNDGERMKKLEAVIRSGNLDGVAVRLGYVMDREEIYEEDGDWEAGVATS
jgi:central kinetochore subunit Mal2/MCM21